MPSWSTKRQLLYLLIPLTVVFVIFGFVYSKYFYTIPSCFDGVKNGNETGVDCGGTCSLLCQGDAIAPVVLWAKSFNVTGNVWNAVAYVQNSNFKSSAKNVPYEFKLYDENNNLVASRQGTIDIPRNKTFAVFEAGLIVSTATVKRTDFQFGDNVQWYQDTKAEPDITITNVPIENVTTSPKVEGTISNSNLYTVGPIELVALVFDGRQNVIGVSKTLVDPLAKDASAPFVFTWPHVFPAGVDVCQVPSNLMLVLDRSGSMTSLSKNPPEPLNSVKNTAVDFLAQLTFGDSAGVVSFATHASNPIDQSLTTDISRAESAVESIFISTSTADQNTNIGDGLQQAINELLNTSANTDVSVGAKKVIILLTDGVPTDPQQPGQVNYPTVYAENIAATARSNGITIYSIGLGTDVNGDVLSSIAGAPERVFLAPNASTLSTIYRSIESSICTRKPNVVEILSRVL
jgi:Mg-chelatase subunit ChlD